jgi:hypothetical protein
MSSQRNMLLSGLSVLVVFGLLFVFVDGRFFLRFIFFVLAAFGLIVTLVAGIARLRER